MSWRVSPSEKWLLRMSLKYANRFVSDEERKKRIREAYKDKIAQIEAAWDRSLACSEEAQDIASMLLSPVEHLDPSDAPDWYEAYADIAQMYDARRGQLQHDTYKTGCECPACGRWHDPAYIGKEASMEPKRETCGTMFGQEILLTGMDEGTGIRRCCLLSKGHEGEHSPENPELDLSDQEDRENA